MIRYDNAFENSINKTNTTIGGTERNSAIESEQFNRAVVSAKNYLGNDVQTGFTGRYANSLQRPNSSGGNTTIRQFTLQAPSSPYQPKTKHAEHSIRSSVSPPIRPLPASHANDKPASTLGGKLDKLATPNDAKLTGIPALLGLVTKPIGAATGLIGKVLDVFGLQEPLVKAAVKILDSPVGKKAFTEFARLMGFAAGLASNFVGKDVIESQTRHILNFVSSEKGGALLASPALAAMETSGGAAGWKGALDGLLSENAGMNLYSTFFLGNLKNRTGGGEGPEFYKQLVVDTWDQNAAGREFLASVGESALSRKDAAAWYSEYYYDVLDEESGNGVATKIVDTLDYRFGLDARNMNQIYKDGAQRWQAFSRSSPEAAADLAGNQSYASGYAGDSSGSYAGTSQTNYGSRGQKPGYAGNGPSAVSHGGLSNANSAKPTGPEISGITSHTRAYKNGSMLDGAMGRASNTLTGIGMAAIFGPGVAAVGGILGQEGVGEVMNRVFDNIISGSGGGSALGAFIDGASKAPGGKRGVEAALTGILTSSAGTAWVITGMQQLTREKDGVEFVDRVFAPLKDKGDNGKSILDRVIEKAPFDPVLGNNLRAIADELDESSSARNALQKAGLADLTNRIRQTVPVAAPYAYLETGTAGNLPLTDPRKQAILFDNAIDGQPAIFDNNGNPTRFASIGIRLFGHDLLDGRVDGDVVLRTLLNPKGSGNEDFRPNIELVKKWGELDLQDDGKVNGSALTKLVSATAGVQSPNAKPPATNDFDWRTDVPQVFDFENPSVNLDVYDSLSRQYGITRHELADIILWGHVIPRLPTDPVARSIAFDEKILSALAGRPNSTFEHIFIRDVPGLRQHYESLIGNLSTFEQRFANTFRKITS